MRILQFLRKNLVRKQSISIEAVEYIEPQILASYASSHIGDSDTTSNTVSYEHAEINLPEKGIRFGYYFLVEGIGSYDKTQFSPDAFVMKTITASLLDAPIEILAQRYSQLSDKECERAIEAAIQEANIALREIATETAGATITVAFIRGRSIIVCQVGANRLYWIDRHKIQQLTREHIVRLMMPNPPWVLYTALGVSNVLIRDNTLHVATLNDIDDGYLLLCTWRLWESICEVDLRDVVMTSSTLEDACTRLLKNTSDPLDERSLAIIIASNPKYKSLKEDLSEQQFAGVN